MLIVICLLMEKKFLNLKLPIKSIFKVSFNEKVYDFSVDYYSIDKSDILNIHKYLMTKNNIK